jgi:hypothetical protein
MLIWWNSMNLCRQVTLSLRYCELRNLGGLQRFTFDGFRSGVQHEKHAVISWNFGNHLSICLKTEENQENTCRLGQLTKQHLKIQSRVNRKHISIKNMNRVILPKEIAVLNVRIIRNIYTFSCKSE